jgi:tetratricopeptide (TPR) repeat protein
MVACPKCVVNNTLDSAFCKKCGAVLPISIIEEEQEKLKEIVTKGMESYQTGNLDEAMAIADHSIITNPSYGEAYALKGLIHERKGAYAEALDAYETVVALNPDSTIDKIKLNQLRNAFAQRQAGEPKADRKGAALIALGVTAACLAIGGISYGILQTSKETKSNVAATNAPVSQNQNLLADSRTNVQPGVNVNPNQKGVTPNGEVVALGPDGNPPIDSTPRTNSSRRSNFDNTGPLEIDGGTSPRGSIDHNPPTSLPPEKGGTKPIVTKNPPTNPPDDTQDPAPTPGGTIDISISRPTQKSGSQTVDANQNSSSGKAYQRQGMANQRNGKTALAREAFQKAIDAFQKEIDSGKGDKDAAIAGMNSSRQALKNLKE